MHDRAQIRQRLVEVLTAEAFSAWEVDASQLRDDTSLLNEIGLDSLQLLDFIMAIERAFGFRVNGARLTIDVFDRFDSVVTFVQSSLSSAVPAAGVAYVE
jgi:acyl carrier protein